MRFSSSDRRRRLLALRLQQAQAESALRPVGETSPAGGTVAGDAGAIRRFQQACGGDSIELAVYDGSGERVAGEVFGQPFLVLGRDPACDVVLTGEGVSRTHAYLQVVGGRLYCCDLLSRTGTWWAGGTRPGGWWNPGADVQVGPFVLRRADAGEADFDDDSPLPEEQAREMQSAGLHAPVILRFARPERQHPADWRVDRNLTLVGRSRRCKVQLGGDDVSGVHCSLVRTDDGVWLVDLCSRTGTRLNGEPVRFARLQAGDVIGIGGHRIEIVVGEVSLTITDDGAGTVARRSAGAGRPRSRTESPGSTLSEEFVLTLVRRFLRDQQRNLGRAQTEMRTLVEGFCTVQQQQVDLINAGIARIRELADELEQWQHRMRDDDPDVVSDEW